MSSRIPLPPHPLTGLIHQHRGPLPNTQAALGKKSITLGFLGGSITDGRAPHNWPDPVSAWFLETFPDTRVHIENAAIGATGSDSAMFRVARDIIPRGCDLIFIEYAVNDNSIDATQRARSREGLIRKLKKETKADLLLVYTFCQGMYPAMEKGEYPPSVADFEKIAAHYHIGSVWMGAQAFLEVQKGAARWEEWLPDGLHPQFRGSHIYGQAVASFLEKELKSPISKTTNGVLPQAIDPMNWENAHLIPFENVELTGPWLVRRSTKMVWVERCLSTNTPGARLAFSFKGRGATVGIDFGKTSAEFRYRIDGGPWLESGFDRPEWVGPEGWYRSKVLTQDLPLAEHRAEIEVTHGNPTGDVALMPRYAGTRLDINHLGVF